MVVLLSRLPEIPTDVRVWENCAELTIGSLVMILMVPPIADEPKRAEPPPRITSMRSIMFAGICSRPYTPARAENTGLEFINICE